jgi:transposase-like protein
MQRNTKASVRWNRVQSAIDSPEKTKTWTTSEESSKDVPKVAILCRVSSTKQEKDGTIENQRFTCQELYKKYFQGVEHVFVGEFSDEAYNLEAKEESRNFWRLMRAIQAGEVNTVITVNMDRVFRGKSKKLNGEISDIFTLASLQLITTSQRKQYDPTDITGRMVDGFLQELGPGAKLEMTVKLQSARRLALTEDEKWRLSIVPFGYRVKVLGSGKNKSYLYSVDEEEAEIVRDIFRLYVGDKTQALPTSEIPGPLGLKKIAHLLNNLKVDKSSWIASIPEGHKAGNSWLAPTLNRMIRNTMYNGKMVVMFGETKPGSAFKADALVQKIDVPVIVDDDLFGRVQKMREAKASQCYDVMQTGAQYKNWLHRKIKCPSCGNLLRGFTSAHKDRYYSCPKPATGTKDTTIKKHRTFRAVDIEETFGTFLMEKLGKNLLYSELYKGLSLAEDSHNRMTQLLKEMQLVKEKKGKSETELNRLTDFLLKGVIEQEQYLIHKERLLNEKVKDEERLKKIADEIAFLDNKKSDVVEIVEDLRKKFEKNLRENPDFTYSVLREATEDLVNFIEIREIKLDISNLELETIHQLYHQGLIVPKQLEDIGWNLRQIYKILGPSGRKAPMNFEIVVHWITGEKTILDPRKLNLEKVPPFDPRRAQRERRRWTNEDKKAILARSLVGGESLTDIARELNIHVSILSEWKRQFRHEFVLPKAQESSAPSIEPDTSAKSIPKSKRNWPEEFKRVVVSEILSGASATNLARKYCIAESMLSAWKKQYKADLEKTLS